jgi:hypothetical protein
MFAQKDLAHAAGPKLFEQLVFPAQGPLFPFASKQYPRPACMNDKSPSRIIAVASRCGSGNGVASETILRANVSSKSASTTPLLRTNARKSSAVVGTDMVKSLKDVRIPSPLRNMGRSIREHPCGSE